MKRVHIASHPADAELVASFLASRGIRSIVRNGDLWPIAGLSMTVDGAPAVWVTEDAHAARALRLVAELREPLNSKLAPWKCQSCEEQNDGPFGLCWKCGHPAPPLVQP